MFQPQKKSKNHHLNVQGLHASISTHICAQWYDSLTKTWIHNLNCFVERVGQFPERIQNLYFAFMVYVRAVSKIAPYLSEYSFCDGTKDWIQAQVSYQTFFEVRRNESQSVTGFRAWWINWLPHCQIALQLSTRHSYFRTPIRNSNKNSRTDLGIFHKL
jgi:hypothetical protein